MPSVTVEVGLDAFDTDDLVSEVKSRGRVVLPSVGQDENTQGELLERLYYALVGNSQQAINAAARELYNLLGDRIL
ncbi:hypothetical protein [Aeromonas dhakensis]|uniref:hypothetical protein n=1 Tax=Aeromonas dhakensis TaxID=196024 RepID=UPI00244A1BDA|nr:hypothetical protein [Aeromonas dhakensis]MDH0348124.1 hypothetical protein [Aeromonas dhakensis]